MPRPLRGPGHRSRRCCPVYSRSALSIWSARSPRPFAPFPLSAGVTLYVAASDLIPEVNTREGGVKSSVMVFAGVALLYLTELVMKSLNFAH